MLASDGKTITVRQLSKDLGMVGAVEPNDKKYLTLLLENGYTPIIASLAHDDNGDLYNVNADDAALAGEETLKNDLNAESELMVNDGGNKKIMELIEHADKGDMTFDDIMESWNKAWNDAQVELGVETK